MALDPKYLKASDGTGSAVLAHITVNRLPLATTLKVDNVDNWPPFFIATSGTLASNGYIVESSKKEFRGHLSGTDIIIDGFEAGFTDTGNTNTQVVILKQTTGWADGVADNVLLQNQNIATFVAGNADWRTNLPAINSVLNNGQRSYDITFASTVAALLSPKMRIRTTRATPAPTQSTLLDGVNRHWTKTSPAVLNTITNGFVVTLKVKISAYPSGVVGLGGTYNGTSGFYARMDTTGQVMIVAHNGGAANWRSVQTKQSVPVNKWTTLVFQVDMGTWTSTPTTNYVMMDDIEVPIDLASSGTNPTVMGAGGTLYIGSINGANFFGGNIAQFGVFNQKVTPTVMRTYTSQSLTNGMTGLVSAYAFNGNGNDINTTNANNLTAQNGATATATDAPFGSQADGSISDTLDYAIVQRVNGSVATVQVPEGCTITTTASGIAAIAYAIVTEPFGFPSSPRKWRVNCMTIGVETVNFGALNEFYAAVGGKLVVPVGEWKIGYDTNFSLSSTAPGTRSGWFIMNPTQPGNLVGAVPYNTSNLWTRNLAFGNITAAHAPGTPSNWFSQSAVTTWNSYAAIDGSTGAETYALGYQRPYEMYADNALL